MITDKLIRIGLFVILMLSANPLPAQLAGGEGDGFDTGTFIGLLSGDSLTTYVAGGDGDGFAHSRRSGLLDGLGISDPLLGGDGDGYGADDFLGFLSGRSTRTMYASGAGDGFAHARASGSLQGVIFPIVFLAFEVISQDERVLLQWITESERHSGFFTIERSLDANTFTDLDWVPASGNPHSRQTYQSIDHAPLSGYSYYRLKATDYDGSFTYSQIVAIHRTKPSTWGLVIYPNPNTGKNIHLDFSGLVAGEAIELEMVDVLGAVVHRQEIKPNADSYEMLLKLNHPLAKGRYLLRMRSAEQQLSRVIIIE